VVLTSAQLETRVLELVDAVRGGDRIEDDLVECKSRWPSTDKARQLAGSANSARGDPLLWILGLDENARQVVPINDQDPAQWWSQIQARFDQDIAPALTMHLRVPVGENEAVIALLFATDRAPYLVKASGGSPEREVPIRDGTRTRSAHRDELIRMMTPLLTIPEVVVLNSHIDSRWYPPETQKTPFNSWTTEEYLSLSGSVWLYFEQIYADVIVLPGHEMSAKFNCGRQEEFALKMTAQLKMTAHMATQTEDPHRRVHVDDGDLICTAPGRATLKLYSKPALHHSDLFRNATEATLSLTLGVAGASRPVRKSIKMVRRNKADDVMDGQATILGQWIHVSA